MSHTQYPTALDLQRHLLSAGMLDMPMTAAQQLLDFSSPINSAITTWENNTGYDPFLATTQTRIFDPPGPTIRGTRYGYRARGGERFIQLDNGLWSLTSVTTGIDAVSPGTLRTLNTDFYLYPVNAPLKGEPYTEIEFVLPVWGSQQSVHIVGAWGYSQLLPDDVWEAILARASVVIVPRLIHLISGGVIEYREEDELKKFGPDPFGSQISLWTKQFNDTVMSYLLL